MEAWKRSGLHTTAWIETPDIRLKMVGEHSTDHLNPNSILFMIKNKNKINSSKFQMS